MKNHRDGLQASNRRERPPGNFANALGAALDAVPVGLLTVDRRLVVRQANEQGRRLLGLRRGARGALGRRLLDGLDDDGRERLQRTLAELPHSAGASCGEVRLASPGAATRVMRVEARAATDGHEVMLAFIDVTEQRAATLRAEHEARHDPLTGLANRAHVMVTLEHSLELARAQARQVGLMFIDLDHFKRINDELGHAAGDQLLCEVGKRLQACSAPGDLPARLGGDEFVVLMPSVQGLQQALERAERVARGLKEPWHFGGHHVVPGASVGLSRFPSDACDGHGLLQCADLALYQAKRRGRGQVQAFCRED